MIHGDKISLMRALAVLAALLLAFSQSTAQAQGSTVPSVIQETEGPFYGTWVLSNGQYKAEWSNGASAVMTVGSFTAQSVVIHRTDTAGSVSRGMTAVYTGQISSTGDRIMNGSVTWTWPGVPGYPATGSWNASWETVKIFMEEKDVTDTTQSVWGGQQIKLKVSFSGSETCASPVWSVEGMTVAGFEAMPSFLNPLAGSAIPSDFTKTSVTEKFYWVKKGKYQVTASCLLGNQRISSQATFNVDIPTVANVSAKFGKINVSKDSSGTWFLQLGNGRTNLGILFRTKPTNTGVYQWVQILDGLQIVKYSPGGVTSTTKNSGLDTNYPYNNNNDLIVDFQIDDNPGFPLKPPFIAISEVMSARMYLMWNPRLPSNCSLPSDQVGDGTCTSISVPIGYIDWEWSGTARYISHNQWELVPRSTSKLARPFVHSSIFPYWLERTLSACYPHCDGR